MTMMKKKRASEEQRSGHSNPSAIPSPYNTCALLRPPQKSPAINSRPRSSDCDVANPHAEGRKPGTLLVNRVNVMPSRSVRTVLAFYLLSARSPIEADALVTINEDARKGQIKSIKEGGFNLMRGKGEGANGGGYHLLIEVTSRSRTLIMWVVT
ncbi:hypothetical protein CRG98_005222 [Punica granatum]|uniref:Uncharacterized protein n=1 Tax=Punica granatum TaxID=22663 RepID=A0A2I0L0V4_PUNGR|nr:hypothetical protein CRG98_005222 [Punica granatum]